MTEKNNMKPATIAAQAAALRARHRISRIGLAGGVFQNRRLDRRGTRVEQVVDDRHDGRRFAREVVHHDLQLPVLVAV